MAVSREAHPPKSEEGKSFAFTPRKKVFSLVFSRKRALPLFLLSHERKRERESPLPPSEEGLRALSPSPQSPESPSKEKRKRRKSS